MSEPLVRATLGLDPGRKSGGIAAIEQGYATIKVCKAHYEGENEELPLGERAMEFLRQYQGRSIAIVEKLGAFRFTFNAVTKKMDRAPMPHQVVKSYGSLVGALQALRIPAVELQPKTWQTCMLCLTGGDKSISKRLAMKLFDLKMAANVTEWNADALLMAELGWRLATGQVRINGHPDVRSLWPC